MNTCYTAIFGNYDDLKDPQVITPGWQYICFTNQDIKSNVWQIVRKEMMPEGPQRTARYYKLMYFHHVTSEKSIWIDASFIINCNLDRFWDKYFNSHISTPNNPFRNCVYLEAEACIRNGRDVPEVIENQISHYRRFVPRNNGMIASGILLRNQSFETHTFCALWWEELKRFSVRDQISWANINHQLPNTCHRFNLDYRYSDEMIFTTHLHKRAKYGKIYRPKRKTKRTGNQIV